MKTSLSLIVLLWLGFINTGCSKKEGPQGPPGNANVKSATYSASSWAWSAPYYYVNLSVPELTSSNINSAAVMVYFKANSSAWVALPYTQYDSPYNYYMGFNTSTGNVQVTWVYDSSLSSGSDPNSYYGTTVSLKVVIIPPAELKAHGDVDLNNYDSVEKAFHLE